MSTSTLDIQYVVLRVLMQAHEDHDWNRIKQPKPEIELNNMNSFLSRSSCDSIFAESLFADVLKRSSNSPVNLRTGLITRESLDLNAVA